MNVPSPRPSLLTRLADRFGATASFLCAIHCAALPLVIAALPALGLGFLADHRFERTFIAPAWSSITRTVLRCMRSSSRSAARSSRSLT
jgi:hypothetical protein